MGLTSDQERMLFECIRDGQNSMSVNGDKLDALTADIRIQNAALQSHPACNAEGVGTNLSADDCDETGSEIDVSQEGDPSGFDP